VEHVHIPYWAVAPFVLVLLGIAIIPLARAHWWEHNKNKAIFAGVVAGPAAIYILLLLDPHMIGHALTEYVQFIILLGSLYVVSGGIVLRGDLKSGPFMNAGLLALGAVLASIIGTTGASMLLIRPFLRANQVRSYTRHIPIFFIFCVSNAGGLLTPLGDPPLFLGYLRGVPFTWTFHLLPEWLFVNGLIIGIFLLIDWRVTVAAGTMPEIERKPVSLAGAHNLIFLLAVVVAVAFLPVFFREATMLGASILSLVTTKKTLRDENGFTYNPIMEVAILFIAIFVTMQPALGLLGEHGPEMGLRTPVQFFLASGVLSSFLDNAPTYVTFFEVARSLGDSAGPLVAATGVAAPLLTGVSLGSVLMGANTYIGNGPNFMVKSICDEAGFKTPTFFGYMVWSLGILGPIWIAIAVLSL
jgi:Na+/H+ antiporter NhaD/arsenite permease-like protein